MKDRIMFIEDKGGGLHGPARIGRVRFSKTRKTLYFEDKMFHRLSGQGYKANHFDAETGAHYWISGCRRDGADRLYPGIVEVDEDVREEYWRVIRERPEDVALTSFRSEGKYSKRQPK